MRSGRAIAWVLLSTLVLLAGFGALVLGLLELAGATGSIANPDATTSRVLAATYFRVVFFKGLLPQLLLTLALWPLLGRIVARRGSGWVWTAAGLAAAAAVAYAVVAPTLLTVELPGWPALQMKGGVQHLGTGLLMGLGVVAAALLGGRLAYGPRRPGGAIGPGHSEATAG